MCHVPLSAVVLAGVLDRPSLPVITSKSHIRDSAEPGGIRALLERTHNPPRARTSGRNGGEAEPPPVIALSSVDVLNL
jgi:hypothetical protein